MLTKKELLQPRVLVLIYYPGSPFKIGEVLTLGLPTSIHYGNSKYCVDKAEVKKSPQVFRILQWWEHRKKEDMPKYLIWGKLIFIASYNAALTHAYIGDSFTHLQNMLPSTEHSYKRQK